MGSLVTHQELSRVCFEVPLLRSDKGRAIKRQDSGQKAKRKALSACLKAMKEENEAIEDKVSRKGGEKNISCRLLTAEEIMVRTFKVCSCLVGAACLCLVYRAVHHK